MSRKLVWKNLYTVLVFHSRWTRGRDGKTWVSLEKDSEEVAPPKIWNPGRRMGQVPRSLYTSPVCTACYCSVNTASLSALTVKDKGGRRPPKGTEARPHPEHFRIDCGTEARACHWASSFLRALCPDIAVPAAVGRGSPPRKPSAACPSRGGVTVRRLRTYRKTQSCLGEGLRGRTGNGEMSHPARFPAVYSVCFLTYKAGLLTSAKDEGPVF